MKINLKDFNKKNRLNKRLNIRISEEDFKFIKKNNLNISLLFREFLRELKGGLKNESKI
jgi:predicted DNA binding CopG/RHH family protein